MLQWLRTFYRRFFSQQFKRSCLPDGPKVGSVSLSPRGDWRMPSDAVAALWLEELEGWSEMRCMGPAAREQTRAAPLASKRLAQPNLPQAGLILAEDDGNTVPMEARFHGAELEGLE